MNIKQLLLSLILLVPCLVHAQQGVGIGTTTPNAAAALDVSASNKGFLMPRIALSAANVWGLTGAPTDGMMIYNTAYAGTAPNVVAPGLYYWKGIQWFSVSEPTSSSPYTASAVINCSSVGGVLSPATSGFIYGQSYSGTITAQYSNGNGGAYPADVVTINGVSLTRQPGVLTGTAQFANGTGNISYTVSGTWTGSPGTANFPLNLPASSCSLTLPMVPATVNSFYAYHSGSFQESVPMTANNMIVAVVNASGAGSYTASTNTLNGVSFNGSGAIAPASNDTVLLIASGVPAAAGTFNYTITVNGQTYPLAVTFAPALYTTCSDIVQGAPASTLVNNSTYIGYMQWNYINGNGLTVVPAQTIGPVNGLYLSRPATNISSGTGVVIYTIYGTYTGTTGGTVSFPVSLDGYNCTVNYGDAIRRAMYQRGCTSCTAYDAASAGTWISVTSFEYNDLLNILTNTAVVGASTAAITSTITNTVNTSYNITGTTGTPTNAKIPGGSYIVGFAVDNAANPNAFLAPTRTAPKVKFSTTLNSGFTNYGGSLPDEALGLYGGTTSYFILKTPSAIASTLNTYLGYYDGGGPAPIDDNDAGYTSQKGTGNTGTLSTTSSAWWRIQAITTTAKQW